MQSDPIKPIKWNNILYQFMECKLKLILFILI